MYWLIFTLILEVQLRYRQPLFAPRYLIVLLPFLWITLGMAARGVPTRFLKCILAFLLIVTIYIELRVDIQNARDSSGTFGFFVAEQMAKLARKIPPNEPVVYDVDFDKVFSDYYGLKSNAPLSNEEILPAIWFISCGLNREERVELSRKKILNLSNEYALIINPEELNRHFSKDHFAAARISGSKIQYFSICQGNTKVDRFLNIKKNEL